MQACNIQSTARKQRRSALNGTTTEIAFDTTENNNSYEHLLNALWTQIHEEVGRQLASNG